MTNSNRYELNVACLSDIHLGHRRNRTLEIVHNLYRAFPDNAETASLDIIWFAGDVFDDLMSLSDEGLAEIDVWIAHFLRLCKRHDIMVRVLEGTPSHDWKQSYRFTTINEVAEIGADLQHVKELSIEYIERFGITVLYVPDEWENTTDKTLSQVHKLLHARGLDKVDYAIMHGQFDYQVPAHLQDRIQKHDSKAYLALVRHLIFIGHVHLMSSYDRIFAQGSFDRLSHGEEGPKGHYRATIKNNGDYKVTFVETENAKRFVTIDCTNMDLDQTLEKVDRVAGPLPEGSFVRIEADAENPIFANMDLLIRNHPFFTWSKLPRDKEEEEKLKIVEDETIYVPITLTRDNLAQLLIGRMVDAAYDPKVVAAARDILKDVI